MKTRIDDLLDLHNEMWVTLHRLRKANEEHRQLVTNPIPYYEQFGTREEYQQDIAKSELTIKGFTEQYTEQLNQLKTLTETAK